MGLCEAPTCRRVALLDYFGERIEPCGNCDVCIDPVEMTDGTALAQKALSAVFRTGQRYGAAHIIDVLRGTTSQKVEAAGHDRLPTFGTGADLKIDEWRSIVRQLVAAQFLRLDVQRYGSLTITEKGQGLLRGDEEFRYRNDTTRGKSARRGKKADPLLAAAGDPPDPDLLSKLKALRLELSSARGVPAYVIFPDRTLIDMARRRPKDLDEFSAVNGVGAAKLRDFGEIFLEAINGEEPTLSR